MKKQYQQDLFDKYPMLFSDRFKTVDKTRMCDGIRCGDGWWNLIDDVCAQLTFLSNHLDIRITFFQIKEKFATLRIYVNYPTCRTQYKTRVLRMLIDSIVEHALYHSEKICELCGEGRECIRHLKTYKYAYCNRCWRKFLKRTEINEKTF